MIKELWDGYIKPFKIFGNLYFVGTIPASAHLIDTGDGLILLDCGYQEGLYMLIENIYELGFNPKNIKYVIHTHAHIDHCGAAMSLKKLYGCELCVGERDKLYADGTLDLTYAKELGMDYIPFTPDILIKDGDVISLGNTSIRAISSPGHTPGTTTFVFTVTDGSESFIAGLHGGAGINTLFSEFLDKYNLPYSYRDEFVASMKRLAEEKVDIFLGNHAIFNDTAEKAEKIKKGDKYAFVNPAEWSKYVIDCIDFYEEMVLNKKL